MPVQIWNRNILIYVVITSCYSYCVYSPHIYAWCGNIGSLCLTISVRRYLLFFSTTKKKSWKYIVSIKFNESAFVDKQAFLFGHVAKLSAIRYIYFMSRWGLTTCHAFFHTNRCFLSIFTTIQEPSIQILHERLFSPAWRQTDHLRPTRWEIQ